MQFMINQKTEKSIVWTKTKYKFLELRVIKVTYLT